METLLLLRLQGEQVSWAKHTNYRGQTCWRYCNQLVAVVRENPRSYNRRFEVLCLPTRVDSNHQTLGAAKRRVLELLVAELCP
jgi:hypothetical protein